MSRRYTFILVAIGLLVVANYIIAKNKAEQTSEIPVAGDPTGSKNFFGADITDVSTGNFLFDFFNAGYSALFSGGLFDQYQRININKYF